MGGGLIYLEANYITVTGTITANGIEGGTGMDTNTSSAGGGGGGGSGGSIILRTPGTLSLSNSNITAEGGRGGSSIDTSGAGNPGGGGAGGRVILVYRALAASGVNISTAAGRGGQQDFADVYAQNGSSGTVSYGVLASSPANFALVQVFITSAAYSWNSKAGAAEWGQALSYLPAVTANKFKLYASTTVLPFAGSYRTVDGTLTTLTETGLRPDTTVQRFLTAYTDFGDSLPSAAITTVTFAASPAGAEFPSAAADSLAFAWSSGTAAEGFNPAYTVYEISRSTSSDFSAASAGFVTGLSSAPAGLQPNTTYYFRTRARGLNNAYTGGIQSSTATHALSPSGAAFSGVHIDSLSFTWSAGANPAGTLFEAQISENNFLTIGSAALTPETTAHFTGLNPGTTYYARVRAVNHGNIRTSFTAVEAAAPGNFANTADPAKPEPPRPTAQFSYDGSATFTWYPPSGSVPLFSYFLEIGSTPGGNDFLFGYELPSAVLSYSTNTLVSGRTYFARVKAKSSAGKLGDWSDPGPGVAVWISAAQTPVAKPYNWPNPFDPAQGATNIGFNLSAPAEVSLKIFTLQGISVYAASRREPSAGNAVWQWNGRNGDGRMVEPGGYMCLLTKKYPGKTEVQRFKLAVLY